MNDNDKKNDCKEMKEPPIGVVYAGPSFFDIQKDKQGMNINVNPSQDQRSQIPTYPQNHSVDVYNDPEAHKLYCPECGSKIDRNQKFCHDCGSPIKFNIEKDNT